MPDFSTMIIHVLNIIILYIILRYLLYKPVKSFMEQRTRRVAGELEKARDMQEQAAQVTSQAQEILQNAMDESRSMINEGARRAREDADGILAMADQKAKEIIAQARLDIQHEHEAHLRELQSQVGDLALLMAGRILERELRVEDNTAIIERFFNDPSVFVNGEGKKSL